MTYDLGAAWKRRRLFYTRLRFEPMLGPKVEFFNFEMKLATYDRFKGNCQDANKKMILGLDDNHPVWAHKY